MLPESGCKKSKKENLKKRLFSLYNYIFNIYTKPDYAANSTSKCKFTKCLCKSTPLVFEKFNFFLGLSLIFAVNFVIFC